MKQRVIAALLAFFLGEWGIHKFYLNEQKQGKRYLIWCIIGVLLSIIVIGLIPLIILFFAKIIDGIGLLFMSDEEFNEKYNKGITQRYQILND